MNYQEVWITIRFKGEINIFLDAESVASDLAHKLYQYIERGHGGAFQTSGLPSAIAAEVMHIEEEADIYETREPIPPDPEPIGDVAKRVVADLWDFI